MDLIVTIVRKGWAEEVVKASRRAGAEGGTILHGRGTGIHEKKTILGIAIEPEKDVVLTVVNPEQTDRVLDEIMKAADLDKPGMGIGFVIRLERVIGRVHMFEKESGWD
ncbi:nitrogen regulatory protein p-ii [hydrocarbon metagenome]|uniref:Nitrogen regulatory protein p-ii n=1 Tax=hydrocarbon metagenome TaxID=938273 RepID=A0A0W8FGL1_9ZZZZ|nr:P-II family nitrogen regulator [Methanomicrobiaceae archaeon]